MYLFASRSKKPLLCALFGGCRLLRYISVLNWEVGALEVIVVFNTLFARFIWQGFSARCGTSSQKKQVS